jgi:membrane protease subunit HflK
VAARLTEEANGYKQTAIATSQGDASRFRQILAEYEKAPQVTRERLYLESMQQILSNTTKVIVDQKGGQNLLYLPLDKLIQMTAQQGPTVSAQGSDVPLPRMATPAAEPAAAAPVDARARDALRSRER